MWEHSRWASHPPTYTKCLTPYSRDRTYRAGFSSSLPKASHACRNLPGQFLILDGYTGPAVN
jgi:hypothetical protein